MSRYSHGMTTTTNTAHTVEIHTIPGTAARFESRYAACSCGAVMPARFTPRFVRSDVAAHLGAGVTLDD